MKNLNCYLFSLILVGVPAMALDTECAKPWIYLDLGNTIIDTKTNDYKPMFYMSDVSQKNEDETYLWKDGPLYKSSQDYVNRLKKENFTLGMIIDISEDWGLNYPSHNPITHIPTAKIVRTLDFLKGKYPEEATWREGDPFFDYSVFGNFTGHASVGELAGPNLRFEGELELAQNNSERKKLQGVPNSDILFKRALERAKELGCKAIYQGEDTDEMSMALGAGMIPFQVGKTSKKYFYLPPEKVNDYIEKFQVNNEIWKGLGDADFE